MNSQVNINARMLMLYPVNVVKAHFEKNGHKGVVITQIATSATAEEVNSFIFENINRNKLHVYIYDLNPPFNRRRFNTSSNPFPFDILLEEIAGNEYTFYVQPQITYSGTAVDLRNGKAAPFNMIFQQPIAITVNERYLIIRAIIVEKKVEAYMNDKNIKTFEVSKSNDDDFQSEITRYFLRNYGLAKCNLNKGIKYLCDNDIVDFKSLRLMNSSSVDTIVMNEDLTFKEMYPKEYKDKMKAPLSKSQFKYLLDDFAFCPNFVSDPNSGEITIPLYPTNSDQVNNVIDQILSNN